MEKSNRISKKHICWITASWFLNVDIPIVPQLSQYYNIDWKVLFYGNNGGYTIEDFRKQVDTDSCRVEIVKLANKGYHLGTLWYYFKLLYQIRRKYDFVYINMPGYPYFFPLATLMRRKIFVYACHDVIQHVGVNTIRKKYQNFILEHFEYFHFFSNNQYQQFKRKFSCRKYFISGLPLPDFGVSSQKPIENKVVFTYFGTIRPNKGLKRLIEAGNLLSVDSECKNRYIIRIMGYHSDFEKTYGQYILDKSNYLLDIRKIPNNEISDIMCSSHFLVLPYKDVTQSGPLLIAYSYKLPVIASDLEGFHEYILNGYNGYLFKSNEPKALYETMKKCICNTGEYKTIKEHLIQFIKSNLSNSALLKNYISFFDNIHTI